MNSSVWTLTKYTIFSDVNCIYKSNEKDVSNPEYECNDLKLLVKYDNVQEKMKDTRSGMKDNESNKNIYSYTLNFNFEKVDDIKLF